MFKNLEGLAFYFSTAARSELVHLIPPETRVTRAAINIYSSPSVFLYCRSLIKVKFSTDQFRLLQDQAVVRRLSIVTMLKNLEIALFQTFLT